MKQQEAQRRQAQQANANSSQVEIFFFLDGNSANLFRINMYLSSNLHRSWRQLPLHLPRVWVGTILIWMII